VQAISVRHETRAQTFRLEGGGWVAARGSAREPNQGAKTPDSGRVRELVRELIKLRVSSVVSEQPRAGQGLERPRAELSLGLSEGAPLKLALGAPSARGVYARLGDALVVEVGPEVERAVLELAGGSPLVSPEAAVPEPAEEGPSGEPEEHEHLH
jgi:hypothetical protein